MKTHLKTAVWNEQWSLKTVFSNKLKAVQSPKLAVDTLTLNMEKSLRKM